MQSSQSTTATSVFEEEAVISMPGEREQNHAETLQAAISNTLSKPAGSIPSVLISQESQPVGHRVITDDEDDTLTTLSEFEVDDENCVAKRRSGSSETPATDVSQPLGRKIASPRGARRSSVRSKISGSATPSQSQPSARFPGDYVNTHLLLSQKYSAWIQCTICQAQFVQHDSYQIRAACPRCERHSKLYGFEWPKTERAGKWDHEVRITDHREVQRFVAKRKAGEDDGDEEDKAEQKMGRPKKARTLSVTKVKGGIWKGWVDPAIRDMPKEALAKIKRANNSAKRKSMPSKAAKKDSAKSAARPKGVQKTMASPRKGSRRTTT
jgi:histone-lysine N-methyltransferase SUV420H